MHRHRVPPWLDRGQGYDAGEERALYIEKPTQTGQWHIESHLIYIQTSSFLTPSYPINRVPSTHLSMIELDLTETTAQDHGTNVFPTHRCVEGPQRQPAPERFATAFQYEVGAPLRDIGDVVPERTPEYEGLLKECSSSRDPRKSRPTTLLLEAAGKRYSMPEPSNTWYMRWSLKMSRLPRTSSKRSARSYAKESILPTKTATRLLLLRTQVDIAELPLRRSPRTSGNEH